MIPLPKQKLPNPHQYRQGITKARSCKQALKYCLHHLSCYGLNSDTDQAFHDNVEKLTGMTLEQIFKEIEG